MDICQISEEMMEQVEKQISMIEERLQVRFTDERLKELPLIMCLTIIRTQKEEFFENFQRHFNILPAPKNIQLCLNLQKNMGSPGRLRNCF